MDVQPEISPPFKVCVLPQFSAGQVLNLVPQEDRLLTEKQDIGIGYKCIHILVKQNNDANGDHAFHPGFVKSS